MATETKAVVRKPRRWLRWLAGFFICMIVGLVMLYFIGTSEWALKSVILPKVSKAMNAEVTVDGASISPFSSVDLRGLKVVTKGPEPLVTAKEVRARYSLMDIIKGNINVSEVALESPTVNLITFADGTSNLDPITKAPKESKPQEKKEPKAKKDEKPPQLNLQKFALNNATVRQVQQRKDGSQQVIQLSGVNITAADLANNKTGKLTLTADVNLNQGLSGASNGVLVAKVAGNFDVSLDAELKPKSAKGQTKVDVAQAEGPFAQANALGVTLNTDLTPTQLNDVSVRFTQSGKNLGAIVASGPFSAETMEGKINVAITGIDKQLLNLVGTAKGIDFNQTAVSSTNTIELTQKGRVVSVNGALLVGSFGVTQKGQTTPAMDIRSGYAVTMDQTNKTALIQNFTLTGTQGGSEFLRGTLAKPMMLDLGKTSGAVDESAFDLVITNFNLPDWQAFIGTNATVSSGKLAVNLNLVSKQAGKSLALNLATRLTSLTAIAGSNRIDNADIGVDAKGLVQDFSAVKLDSYSLQLARGGQRAVSAMGALAYNTKSQDADVQADLEVALPVVASLVVVPGLSMQSGTVKFAGHVVQKNTTPTQTNNPAFDRSVVGKLNLAELTGAMQSNRFDRFATAVDLDVAMRGDAVDIKKCSGAIQQSGQAGGSFDVAGNYNLNTKGGKITAKLVDLNQHALKSFLASALGDKQLETVTINATANADLASATDGAVKAELHVANLVVNDPSGAVPRTPLAVDFAADAVMAKAVYDIKGVQLALTKTERAENKLNVSGRIDMSKSNAWTGNLKVASDGLDLTTFYDLFAKKKGTNAVQTASTGTRAPAPTPSEAKPEKEPDPIKLPFTQFVADLNFAKIFLREVAISNLVSKTSIDNGRVSLNPFTLSLNGSPVSLKALANVGVPGWEYDVSASLDHVPIEPLANTFTPDQRGIYKGAIVTSVDLKGAGVTGRSLQKNLGGQISFVLTNAEVRYQDARFENHVKWIVGWVPLLTTYFKVPELQDSPISLVDSKIEITNGVANLQRTLVQSSAFEALVNGPIQLQEVLTNSTLKLPVQVNLRRSIAQKARLIPAGGEQSGYATFPSFVTVEGTIGAPKYNLNERSILQIIAQAAAGGLIRGDAGKLLQGLGNLTGGTATNTTTGTSTNAAPATNSSPANLLKALPGLFDKQPSTNAPSNPRRRRQ